MNSTSSIVLDRRSSQPAPALSVVIPCRNEALFLPQCLASIQAFMPASIDYEIIVVDNQSTDDSARIAAEGATDVLLSCNGRIGACRNAGAAVARGKLLAFLDADIVLTKAWQEGAGALIPGWISAAPERVWGSWPAARPDGTWIERAWFSPMRFGRKTHMGAAHMIIRRSTFESLGGFDPTLETGEDYEFCCRANGLGVPTENDAELVVVHLGYPRSLTGFFRRERWHGRGDTRSWQALKSSRVAVTATISAHLSAVGFIGVFVLPVHIAALLLAALPSAGLAACLRIFGRSAWQDFLQKWFLAQVYLVARAASLYTSRGANVRRERSFAE